MTCFRGNPQRNYYGDGPIPTGNVHVLWRSPIGVLPAGHWSGVGWTGQPLIVEWPDAVRRHMNFINPPGPKLEIVQGALDGQVHFYDAETGKPSRPVLSMPSPRYPIKGTVTVDPRGYPVLYVGAGVDIGKPGYRVFSLIDFKELLWIPPFDSKAPRRWVGTDSNTLILNDHLLLPAENGLFYKIKLNTVWNEESGKISIAPEIQKVPISSAGTENSMSVWGNRGFFADNYGALFRIDLDTLEMKKIFDLKDDSDSSPAIDPEGYLYIGHENDRLAGKGGHGGIYKLDQDGNVQWKWLFEAGSFMGGKGQNPINGGILSTGALDPERGLVYYTTSHHPRLGNGHLIALDMKTGKLRWKVKLRAFAWSSPICAEGVVFCADSTGAAYIRDAQTGETRLTDADGLPKEYLELGANVEASPIVWKGKIYVGIRGGALVCLSAD